MNKNIVIIVGAIIIIAAIAIALNYKNSNLKPVVNSFEECVAAGYPVMESYPRKCQKFIEDIGNVNEKADLIRINSPRPNDLVKSPLVIKGEARGNWFFEASFPIKIFDANGKQLGIAVAQAKSDWMTANFVPYEAALEFEAPVTAKGILVLEKDNPSGLPQNADQLTIPVYFSK
ncbi:MAG: Gmad2 immunoglobulin-like domain-containing protein [Candidatus Paceibacterota bacterium]